MSAYFIAAINSLNTRHTQKHTKMVQVTKKYMHRQNRLQN